MNRIIYQAADKNDVVNADWGRLIWYAGRKKGNQEDMTVGICVLKPGCSNPKHSHPNCSEVLVVRKGRIRHTIDEEGHEVEMTEGDTISIPPRIAHNATNIGDEDAELFIAFSSADREAKDE
jgi:quercetin dioxygenase-like cupin family protein